MFIFRAILRQLPRKIRPAKFCFNGSFLRELGHDDGLIHERCIKR